MACPSAQDLADYIDGNLAPARAAAVAEHLGDCRECRSVVLLAGRSAPEGGSEPPPIDKGSVVGRYLVVERLGQGGMGVVYAAYDPELDRRVALKLIRADRAEGGAARLSREARALAKLQHPNVVAVHDVGALGDGVFVAMELVAGGTLRDWLRAEPRRWRDIVAMFLGAGRGLAAAHAADLVHRDFKPDNVLVGGDGRPRVTDFGLARATAPPAATDFASGDTVTRDGALAGTPAYMAPEQLRGTEVDAAADQFSFCASLWEGLAGERPFSGSTTGELLAAIERARPELHARVPTHVARALARGLSSRPAGRFPSMDALLAALDPEPRARRRRLAIGGAAALALAGTAFALRPPAQRLCRGAAAELSGVWDGGARAAVREAFAATGRPYAAETLATVSRMLDGYAAAWTAMRTESCEATQVRGVQSAQLLDLRSACLLGRRDALAAATALLARADAQVLDKAVSVVEGLEPLAPCADAAALTAEVPPPAGAEARARVLALQSRLATARALLAAGKTRAGLGLAAAATVEASQVDYAPLSADGYEALTEAEDDLGSYAAAEEHALRAAAAAARGRDDRGLAAALLRRLELIILDLHRPDSAALWLPAVETALARAGNPPREQARLFAAQSNLETALNQRVAARVHAEASLALRLATLGPLHTEVARSHGALARLAHADGRYEDARREQQAAVAIFAALLGPRHPLVAGQFANLGIIEHAEGNIAAARRDYETSLAIQIETVGEMSPEVAGIYNNLGNLANEEDRWDEASRLFHKALDIRLPALGPDSTAVAEVRFNLADAELKRGDFDGAARDFGEALRVYRLVLGAEHPDVADAMMGLAEVEARRGHRAAIDQFRVVVAMAERTLGKEHPRVAETLMFLGSAEVDFDDPAAPATLARARAILDAGHGMYEVLADTIFAQGHLELRHGRLAAARPFLERALALREEHRAGPAALAEARFALARALGPADAHGRALATQAAAEYAALPPRAKELAEVRRWLDRR